MKKFRPSLIPWLAVFALTPLLLWLSNWQYERYLIRDKAETAMTSSAGEAIAWTDIGDVAEPRFKAATASGHYDGKRQFLIDNMVLNGRNGFFVITPFQLDNGQWLLVNRGWVAQDPGRQVLPIIDVAGEPRQISGRVGRLPVAGLELELPPPAAGWPSVRQFPDASDLARALNVEVSENILLLDPAEPAGYQRDWKAGGLPASRHLGYAVQWLALAITLWVIAIIMSFRKVDEEQ